MLMMQHFLAALQQVDRHLVAINENNDISFGDLWRDLEAEARSLIASGVNRGDVVAVDLPASPRAIVSLLAIWRIGATYLPLAQDWPKERKAFVLTDANAKLVIGEQRRPLPPTDDVALPSIESLGTDLASHLIYTSGSTGAPKGVLVSHRAIVSVLRAQIEELGLGPGKRCLLLLSLAFDASLSDIGTSLLSGATLVIPPSGARLLRDPDLLLQTLTRELITHVDLPPAIVMKMDPVVDCTALEHVILGGEPCAHDALVRWSKRGIKMTIAYGPTEATICTSMHRFDLQDPNHASMGRPLPHVRYRIDQTTSELLISGPALAIRYHNRPDLDRTRFVDGWFRTGDRARELEDGSFVFLGRTDRQFKSHGVLIAPEEIEAALLKIPNITRAAVLCQNDEIVAFVESDLDDVTIRKQLLDHHLPASMCPRRFIRGNIPTTTSGKPNHAALDADNPLRGLFASVLKVAPEAIADDADFFLLGGDSFAVLDLVAAARAHGIFLSPAAVFEHRRLDRIATKLEEKTFGELRSEVETRIVPPSKPSPRRSPSRDDRQILVTGATGFLGSRVLRHLLARSDLHRIYCLIRGGDRSRLEPIAQGDPRVVAIKGDLAAPHFGLQASLLNELAGAVTDVFHLGAAVDMVRPYSLLAPANVDGTISVLQFAEAAGARLHYASTLSVFVHTDRASGVHREDDDLLSSFSDDVRIHGGYAQTKVAAEIAVRRSPSVSASIFRFGLLTSDAEPFVSPRGCQLELFLAALRDARALPPGIDRSHLRVDITPIDYAARAIIALALLTSEPRAAHRTFHIANPQPLSLHEIVEHIEHIGGASIETAPVVIDEQRSMLLLSLLRRTSTDLFLATDCDFDTGRTARVLAERHSLVCPDAASILKAYLQR
jgi:amino acid adenylation domain-containing protein/thioester reductase-like protein